MQEQQNVGYHHPSGAPPPYSPPMMVHQPPIIVQPTPIVSGTVIVGQNVGSKPAVTVCRSCNAEIITRVEYSPSMRTHLMAGLLCLVGCWPCVCVPYCIESCNNIDHYCPNCSAYIGSYQH